jgi:nitroreductase
VGLASAQLILQAQSMGLAVHPMAGFDPGRARELLEIPEDHEPVAALAIGYPGEGADLPDGLREREMAPRERDSLVEIARGAGWNEELCGLGGE